MTADFAAEAMQARRNGPIILKYTKKNSQHRIFYAAKLSLKDKVKINYFFIGRTNQNKNSVAADLRYKKC